MSNIVFYASVDMSNPDIYYGNVTQATTSTIIVSDGVRVANYGGSFSYTIYGEVFGTLTSYSFSVLGQVEFVATNIDANANDVFYAIEVLGSPTAAYQIVLGGQDRIVGSNGPDTILVYDGNDTLEGGNGNDRLYGGNGSDTAVIGASQTDATASAISGGYQIATTLGVDQFFEIEYFEFLDGTVAAADLIQTGTHGETINGTSGEDLLLLGTNNDDTLLGAGGDDVIAGADGNDSLSGGTGNDSLFGDGIIAAYYGANFANQVYRLYQATLDRAPDITGHANWVGRIYSGERSLAEVAEGFVRSPQFKATYSDNLSDSAFVTLLYNNVLDRAPDAQGLARWGGELANGATRAEVVLGFSQSPQFVTDTTVQADIFALNSAAASWGDEVYRLYQATLDRAPDVTGQNRWTGELASNASSLLDVADGFVRSPQFQATYQNLDNTAFVTLLYNNVLNRAPDAGGLARWVGDLEGGASRAEVVLGFSQSPQFAANTEADVKVWMRDQGTHDRIEPGADDNLVAGGQYADVFVFNANDDGHTTVVDLETWDFIELNGFGYGGTTAVRAEMAQSGNDVVFADQGVEVIFRGVDLAYITDDMILV